MIQLHFLTLVQQGRHRISRTGCCCLQICELRWYFLIKPLKLLDLPCFTCELLWDSHFVALLLLGVADCQQRIFVPIRTGQSLVFHVELLPYQRHVVGLSERVRQYWRWLLHCLLRKLLCIVVQGSFLRSWYCKFGSAELFVCGNVTSFILAWLQCACLKRPGSFHEVKVFDLSCLYRGSVMSMSALLVAWCMHHAWEQIHPAELIFS